MTKRYFVPELPESGGLIDLPAAESQHAIRVMRIKVGEPVELFNGRGKQCDAVVTEIQRNQCSCQSAPPQVIDREPDRFIRMGIALPKPDRSKELIERLTELGVQHITPLIAERTQRAPTASTIDKLQRVIIEACKQSGRNQLLELGSITTAADYFMSESSDLKLVAHPTTDGISPISFANHDQKQICAVAVGPEGGWTESEYQLAVKGGFAPVNLGKRIYRIETAAVALAAIMIS